MAPKTAFTFRYHEPGYWNWINEPSLTLALFVSAMWLRARARTRHGSQVPSDDPLSLSSVLVSFARHESDRALAHRPVARAPHRSRATLTLLGWFVAKAAALVALRRLGPGAFLLGLGPAGLDTLGRSELWGMVIASYLETFLCLAATADIPILIGRLFGFPLPDPFRFPCSRGIRRALASVGDLQPPFLLSSSISHSAAATRKYLNVMLTFLASALLLHSGWFGSKYWQVGVADGVIRASISCCRESGCAPALRSGTGSANQLAIGPFRASRSPWSLRSSALRLERACPRGVACA